MRTTFFAAFLTLLPKLLALAGFLAGAVFALAGDFDFAGLFLTGFFLTGLFFTGLFLATVLVALGDLVTRGPEPFAAARIFRFVSADGCFNWEVFFAGDFEAGFVDVLEVFAFFFGGALTVAFTLDAALTVGSFTFFFFAGDAELVVSLEVVTVFLAVAFPRELVALVMTFLTLALIDFG